MSDSVKKYFEDMSENYYDRSSRWRFDSDEISSTQKEENSIQH